jgi:hypothetical protein
VYTCQSSTQPEQHSFGLSPRRRTLKRGTTPLFVLQEGGLTGSESRNDGPIGERDVEILPPFHVPTGNGATLDHGRTYRIAARLAEVLVGRGQARYIVPLEKNL